MMSLESARFIEDQSKTGWKERTEENSLLSYSDLQTFSMDTGLLRKSLRSRDWCVCKDLKGSGMGHYIPVAVVHSRGHCTALLIFIISDLSCLLHLVLASVSYRCGRAWGMQRIRI